MFQVCHVCQVEGEGILSFKELKLVPNGWSTENRRNGEEGRKGLSGGKQVMKDLGSHVDSLNLKSTY